MSPPATLSLAERFTLILDGVRATLAARLADDRAAGPLLLLMWARLYRLGRRFAALAAQSNTRAEPPSSTRIRPRRPSAQTVRVPRGFAWMIRWVPEVAVYGSQLQFLLAEPEMAELLRSMPRIGRLLRPLCHMLAVAPPTILRPTPPQRADGQRNAPVHPDEAASNTASSHAPDPGRFAFQQA